MSTRDESARAGTLRAALDGIEAGLKAGRYREAAAATVAAAELPPAQPAELVALAQRLAFFTETELLDALARRSLRHPSLHPAADADLAAIASMAGIQEPALRLQERAFAESTRRPSGWLYNRSQMRVYAGRFDAARADLLDCLRADPLDAKAAWALSRLPGRDSLEEEAARLRAMAGRLAPQGEGECFRLFALFDRCDRLGLHAEAWQALAAGCANKRPRVRYDAEATRRYFDALRALPALPPVEADAVAAEEPVPIFIVGMHRSGTTLLERILGSHPQVAEGGELYDFPAQLRWAAGRHFAGASDAAALERFDEIDFGALGARYRRHVSWRAGTHAFLSDKLPSNFINLGYLRRALPQARVLHLRRDPMDTCFANLRELFSNACAYSYDQLELAGYYALYARLMRHWHEALPGFVLDVDYAALTADPEAQVRRVLEFCGLPWHEGCLSPELATRTVNTASSVQVREPIRAASRGAWTPYAAQLEPMRAALSGLGVSA